MALLSLPAEVESLARAIYEFQRDTGHKKASCIKFTLQELVNRVAATESINPPRLDIPKRKTRTALCASSRFYNSSWLINTDKFSEAVACFAEIIADYHTIDSSLQQSIASAVTFVVTTMVASIQAKHESEMLSLREIIEKSLLLRDSASATPPPDPDAAPKVRPGANPLPKSKTER